MIFICLVDSKFNNQDFQIHYFVCVCERDVGEYGTKAGSGGH